MPLNNPFPGPTAAEFQVSGVPWVTASFASGPLQIRFGDVTLSGSLAEKTYVTKWIRVANVTTGSTEVLRVAFTLRGLTTSNNYFSLKPGEVFQADLRITELWLSGTSALPYEVTAGLTGIERRQSLLITGSNGVPGVG